jgi:nitrite reductase/ring-hydroxylating ferredoxin subunit
MMRSKESIKSELEAAGLVFDEFSISVEGPYTTSDADWNYKDVPHLSYMHPGVQPVLGIVEDRAMITINLQKLFGLWLPMAVVNYQPNGRPQTYFTTWFFFVLIVTTAYEQLEPLRCRVTSHYAVGGPWLLSWFLPIIRFVLKRNNTWLMEGDIPMRTRRGELRARGYTFSHRTDEPYTFAETMDIGRSNVSPPPGSNPSSGATIDLVSQLSHDGQYLFGDNGHLGLRLLRQGDRLMVFPRMCPHEGACLDDRPCNNGRIKCEWHGRVFAPLAEFNLAGGAAQRKNAGAYEISLAGTVVTISPHAAEIERSAGTGT